MEDGERSAQADFGLHPSAKHQPGSAVSQTRDPTDCRRRHGDGERPVSSLRGHFLPGLQALLLPTEMVVIMSEHGQEKKKKIKKEKDLPKTRSKGWWKWSNGIFLTNTKQNTAQGRNPAWKIGARLKSGKTVNGETSVLFYPDPKKLPDASSQLGGESGGMEGSHLSVQLECACIHHGGDDKRGPENRIVRDVPQGPKALWRKQGMKKHKVPALVQPLIPWYQGKHQNSPFCLPA